MTGSWSPHLCYRSPLSTVSTGCKYHALFCWGPLLIQKSRNHLGNGNSWASSLSAWMELGPFDEPFCKPDALPLYPPNLQSLIYLWFSHTPLSDPQ